MASVDTHIIFIFDVIWIYISKSINVSQKYPQAFI